MAPKPRLGLSGPAPRFEPKWRGRGEGSGPAEASSLPEAKARPRMLSEQNPGLASERLRAQMLQRLQAQGIQDLRVLQAMGRVPRHEFVDPALASRAYEDSALPIGHQQTISQPYVVARALDLAFSLVQAPGGIDKALEIGTGCGYQAAVMAECFPWVASIERIEALHAQARRNLAHLAYSGLHLVFGDGLKGLPAEAPFQVIVLAAGMPEVPVTLLGQLAPGGVLVAPLGAPSQRLVVLRRPMDQPEVYERFEFDEVQFVPILGGTIRSTPLKSSP